MAPSPKRCLLAPAPFKGTFDAGEVAGFWAESLAREFPGFPLERSPVADGGGGTIEVLEDVIGGDIRVARVPGPLGGFVEAEYLYDPGSGTGLVESARVIGFDRVPCGRGDPLRATSLPLGLLLKEVLELGGRTVYVGLGDTVTMDYGVGCATALGFRFTDDGGREALPGGSATRHITRIDDTGVHPALENARIVVLADVRTPIFGSTSIARMYGPQKGAGESGIAILEEGGRVICRAVRSRYGLDIANIEMGGAAGGAAGLLAALLGAELVSGSSFIAGKTGLREKVERADIVLTGEGTIDEQTLAGKGAAEVLKQCRAAGRPVALICGRSTLDLSLLEGVAVVTGSRLRPGEPGILDAGDLGKLAPEAVRDLMRERDESTRPAGRQ
jgi:glycerate kinase